MPPVTSSSVRPPGRHGWPDRFADRVAAALAPRLPARDYLVRAKTDRIRLAAAQLLLLREAPPGLGTAHGRTAARRTPQRARPARETRPGDRRSLAARSTSAFPGSEIASPPGSPVKSASDRAVRHAERVAVLRRQGPGHPPLRQERPRRRQPARLQPLPRRRRPPVGVHQPASVRLGPRVLRHQIAAGKNHHAALRALGNRWLEILWHCLPRTSSTTRPSTSPTATAPSATRPEEVVDRGCLICVPSTILCRRRRGLIEVIDDWPPRRIRPVASCCAILLIRLAKASRSPTRRASPNGIAAVTRPRPARSRSGTAPCTTPSCSPMQQPSQGPALARIIAARLAEELLDGRYREPWIFVTGSVPQRHCQLPLRHEEL